MEEKIEIAHELYQQGKYTEALAIYLPAAEANYAEAQARLGECYDYGYGIEKDYGKAIYWYGKAIENGNHYPLWTLGLCYLHAKGVVQDFDKAIELFRSGVELNHYYCHFCLGACYEFGYGVAKDKKEAKRLYALGASEAGDVAKKLEKVVRDIVKKGVTSAKLRAFAKKVSSE